jgi:C4-dicarboxylate-specific signal transduction histidine kinase
VVLRAPDGQVINFVGTTTDIDEQKRAEMALRQAQEELARINRSTTLGELTASLAHELNQPISGAITNASLCLHKLERDDVTREELRALVARTARDAQRAAAIIGKIRAQFSKGASSRELVDLNEILLETIALLRDEATLYDISIRTELDDDLPQIIGDRVQLQQVAMNLFNNGVEAMKNVDGPRDFLIQSRQARDQSVLISMSDTGGGVEPELAARIFEPFFTTKTHGIGMGLRICRSIIELHGGRLWCDPNPGPGMTFWFSVSYGAAGSGDPIPSSPDQKNLPGASARASTS